MVELTLDRDMLENKASIDYHIECATFIANNIGEVLNKGIAYYEDDRPEVDGYINCINVNSALNEYLYSNGPDWTFDNSAPSVYCECHCYTGEGAIYMEVITDNGYYPNYITNICIDATCEEFDITEDEYGKYPLLTLHTIK